MKYRIEDWMRSEQARRQQLFTDLFCGRPVDHVPLEIRVSDDLHSVRSHFLSPEDTWLEDSLRTVELTWALGPYTDAIPAFCADVGCSCIANAFGAEYLFLGGEDQTPSVRTGIIRGPLILSCSTGGGHNAAGEAIKKELIKRGHNVKMFDPYLLVNDYMPNRVGNTYVKLVQNVPRMFGLIYQAGEIVRNIPMKSPVYYANTKTAKRLARYLQNNHFDVMIIPHLFPAEMITYLKRHNVALPTSIFVATDYTCIPFTEETECDYYFVPAQSKVEDYEKRGIDSKKIIPFGIPVDGDYYKYMTKEQAKDMLGLLHDKRYILLSGGSIGAGNIEKSIEVLKRYYNNQKDVKIIVICGNNGRLYNRLKSKYKDTIDLIRYTDKLAVYMRACDIFISKPGGLSSTEAAVAQVPLIHITPISGCESHNMRYFVSNGMSIGVKNIYKELEASLDYISNEKVRKNMFIAQEKGIPEGALRHICDWLENKYLA
ncbi:MAG: glycosyltransferase [Eubacterium sp.]